MEKLTLTKAVNELAAAYAALEVAKEECKDVVDATLDAYFDEITVTDKNAVKLAKATRRTEARNIKKLAKAMMKGEKETAKEEAENMTGLIEELGK